LKKKELQQLYHFTNGARLVYQNNIGKVSHVCVVINTGCRDELPDQQGYAHFIEHLLFKGTAKRSTLQVISGLEDVGGELNAYTTKEYTVLYAVCLNEHVELAFDLICDILFNSRLPEEEIKKEREIIIDEINSYLDSPSELIYDDFESLLFFGNSMGHNILGEEDILKKAKQKSLKHFYTNNYNTSNMVFAYYGSVSNSSIEKIANKFIATTNSNKKENSRIEPLQLPVFDRKIKKDTNQVHCILGSRAYSLVHNHQEALTLLNNILGGPAANSILNLSVREKKGYTYTIDSQYNAYTDTGVFSIYFGTQKQYLDECLEIIYKESLKLCTNKLSLARLDRAKKQMLGQVIIARENAEYLCQTIAKSYLFYNEYADMTDVEARIEKITAMELLDVANEIIHPKHCSKLLYY